MIETVLFMFPMILLVCLLSGEKSTLPEKTGFKKDQMIGPPSICIICWYPSRQNWLEMDCNSAWLTWGFFNPLAAFNNCNSFLREGRDFPHMTFEIMSDVWGAVCFVGVDVVVRRIKYNKRAKRAEEEQKEKQQKQVNCCRLQNILFLLSCISLSLRLLLSCKVS